MLDYEILIVVEWLCATALSVIIILGRNDNGMGDLTDNFSLSEFYGANSGRQTFADELKFFFLCAQILQPARGFIGRGIKITSGKRSREFNKQIGGSKTSDHICDHYSVAADFKIRAYDGQRDYKSMREVFHWIRQNREGTFGQLIAYLDDKRRIRWLHVSLPNGRRLNDVKITMIGSKKYEVYNGQIINS